MPGATGNRRFLLIDGNSLTYRAFFALPTDLATASGQVTNAVFGFTSMLINILRDHPSDGIAVAFDRAEPTFRHERVADYKAGRAETPDILRQQMGLVREVLADAGHHHDRQGRIRGRRHPRHAGDPGPRRGPRRHRRHRRPGRLPTGRGPPHLGALQQAGRLRLRALRRGRHRGTHRRASRRSTSSTPRCGATSRTTCPACRAWGRRPQPSCSTPTAISTASSPTSTPRPRSCRENLAAHEELVRENAVVMDLIRDMDLDDSLPGGLDDLAMGEIDVDELKRPVRLPRVPLALRPADRGPGQRPRGHAVVRRARGRGARHPRRPIGGGRARSDSGRHRRRDLRRLRPRRLVGRARGGHRRPGRFRGVGPRLAVRRRRRGGGARRGAA